VDAENVTIDRAHGGEIRTLFIDGVEVTIDRTGEVIVEGFLTLFPNAAAAYSLQRLNGHQALINARRGSDNAEVDVYPDNSANREVSADSPITVTSGSSSATTFGDFLTEDVEVYSSDYSAGKDSWSFSIGSLSAPESIGGEDDVLKITKNGDGFFFPQKSGVLVSGKTYTFDVKLYVPSSNTSSNLNFNIREAGGGPIANCDLSQSDAWESFSVSFTAGAGNTVIQVTSDVAMFDGDAFYIKDFIVTQTSGNDAFVTTWYDQAGSNDASQSIDDRQPKIAEDGSLIVDANGKPWLDFQNAAGGSIGLDLASNIRETNGASSIFASIKFDGIFTGGTSYQNLIFLHNTQRWMVGSVSGPVDYKDIVLSDAGGTSSDFRYVRFPCTLTNHNLLSSIYDGSSTTGGGNPDIQFYKNSVSQVGTDGSLSFGVPTTGNNSIGYNTQTSNQGCNAKFQEIIIYDSDQSANREAIEANINERYSIY
jgi:hypothetical protein